ncbi:hypothetical protein [Nitratifractor sp.]
MNIKYTAIYEHMFINKRMNGAFDEQMFTILCQVPHFMVNLIQYKLYIEAYFSIQNLFCACSCAGQIVILAKAVLIFFNIPRCGFSRNLHKKTGKKKGEDEIIIFNRIYIMLTNE